jgi:parallel beta-helix repeat protein
MKLKSVAVLIAIALTIGLFVTALQISPVRAVSSRWIVDSLKRPGWNFASLASAINSPLVVSGDQIHVLDSHVESLLANLVILQNNLWIIGAPPSSGPTPKIDVNGFTISISGTNVFIWGLNIVDTGTPPSAGALLIGAMTGGSGGCIIENNTITGQSHVGSTGIVIMNSANNLVALNTISTWDYCIVVTGGLSTGNDIKLNTLNPPFSKGIWLSNALGRPTTNKIYWNNLWAASELVDDLGNPANYFDDTFPGGPNWGKGNWIAISDPLGLAYLVPPNNLPPPSLALKGPISQIRGDVNLDGIVNILDAILTGNDFLKVWCQLGWNPRTDLNGDGVVNILDLIILANNFGHHY